MRGLDLEEPSFALCRPKRPGDLRAQVSGHGEYLPRTLRCLEGGRAVPKALTLSSRSGHNHQSFAWRGCAVGADRRLPRRRVQIPFYPEPNRTWDPASVFHASCGNSLTDLSGAFEPIAAHAPSAHE